MNSHELELLEQTVSALTRQHDGPDLTAALDAFGWRELLADEPEAAIAAVFGSQGELALVFGLARCTGRRHRGRRINRRPRPRPGRDGNLSPRR